MTVKIEAQTSAGEWADLTKYMQAGGEHAPDWGPPFPDPMRRRIETGRRFGKTLERELAYRVRKAELNDRLQLTEGTGNLMVNMCRSGTRQSAADKAMHRKGGPGRTQMHHPNRRLAWYGLTANINGAWEQPDAQISGGTARQRACYRRAVERYLADPKQGPQR